ncbi:stellacyanin-like [Benincasa hispida]|uniref:stellacyanin-like n=1 Tax=Benincasa hispida TaxID=102211 RepID=UPI0019024160|nr:stellacyanin-like [Benincasa hispida]
MDKTVMICCLVMMMMGSCVNAFTHIVGGSHGWRVPENITFFDEWTKPRTFGVGDRLVFPYRPGANNLLAVKKADYDTCGEEAVIHMYFLGPTVLNLTEPGDYYYFDGIGKHCEAGQKLHIQVGSKEGTSGSDPMPFNLETFGIHTNLGPAMAPTAQTQAAANATHPSNAFLLPPPILPPIIAFLFSIFL